MIQRWGLNDGMIQEIRVAVHTRFCQVSIELISGELEVLTGGMMFGDPFWVVFASHSS